MTRPDIPKPGPTHYRTVAALLRAARTATLATRLGPDALPYASLVTVATDHDRCPVLLLSGLADHTQALEADDGRVSLLVEATGHLPNPQTGPRVSLMGRACRLEPGAERERAAGRFLARHPGAALYAGFGDFSFWKLTPERAHLVGGFARAVWLDGAPLVLDAAQADAYARAEADLIATTPPAVISALGPASEPGVWRMAAIDADGVALGNEGGDRVFHLAFDPPADGPEALGARLVALVRSAGSEGSLHSRQ